MRRTILLCAALLAASLIAPTGATATGTHSKCGAVELEDRPRLGQSSRWNHKYHQRRLNVYQHNHPEVFASGYLSGEHFYVGFTENVCWHLDNFKDGLRDGKWRVKAFHADWTFVELRSAQRCANRYFDNRWLNMQGTGVDVWRNKLEVMFKRNTESRRNFIESRCGTVDIRFTEGSVSPDQGEPG